MVGKRLPSITLVSWALNRSPSGDKRTWVLEANAMHLNRSVKSRAAGETALNRGGFIDAILLRIAAVASGSSMKTKMQCMANICEIGWGNTLIRMEENHKCQD